MRRNSQRAGVTELTIVRRLADGVYDGGRGVSSDELGLLVDLLDVRVGGHVVLAARRRGGKE